jgi:hypothetical protein
MVWRRRDLRETILWDGCGVVCEEIQVCL